MKNIFTVNNALYLLLTLLIGVVGTEQVQKYMRIHATNHTKGGVALIQGKVLPIIGVDATTGTAVSVNFDQELLPTIIYVFSPDCSWCARNEANMLAVRKATAESYRFVGIATQKHGLHEFLRQKNYDFQVIESLTTESAQHWNFSGTPQTIVVNRMGQINYSWEGAYVDHQWRVESVFDVKLPGLLPDHSLDIDQRMNAAR